MPFFWRPWLPVLGLLALTSAPPARAIGVLDQQKISALEGAFDEPLQRRDLFGASVAGVGDLDGDGVPDLAVGALETPRDSGSLWILFLNPDGSVKAKQQISDGVGGFNGALERLDRFGSALAFLGDLDGDGVGDLAVSATGDDDGGGDSGAVWILFLESDGTVKTQQKISETQGGLVAELGSSGFFGSALENLGDLDGDGVVDIAVGHPLDDEGGFQHGAVWILFLNPDGSVKAQQKISELQGGFVGPLNDHDNFGTALAALRPFAGSSDVALVVGADRGSSIDDERGAVWVLGLEPDGRVAWEQEIAPGVGGFVGDLDEKAHFGGSASSLGDFDGDGVADVAVGAFGDGGFERPPGSIWLLFLREDGTLASQLEVTRDAGGFSGALDPGDVFGVAIDRLGDVDGDGVTDLAVGASGDDDGAIDAGAVWLLFLEDDVPVCGDAALAPGEECDDGNTRSGDLCSDACERESFLALVGTAEGGSLSLEIEGVPIEVPTFAGESAARVVAALAAAANADPALAGLGVQALARDGFLSTNASVAGLSIDDPGLSRRPASFEVFGAPQGGSLELFVDGVRVVAATELFETPYDVARNLATAINLDSLLADRGVLAFAAANLVVTNGEVVIGAIDDPGLQAATEIGGVTLLALDGAPTPVGGVYDFDNDDAFIRPSRALVDDAGNVYFRTRIGSGELPDALFRAVGDRVEPFVLPGAPAPGTGGGVFHDFGYDPSGVQGVGAVTALSGDGELAFYADVAGGSAQSGVFASDGVSTRALALEGDAPAGLGGALWSIVLPLAINDPGDAVLLASLSDGRAGVFLVSGSDVMPLLFHGDEAPGTGGGLFDFFLIPPSVALGDAGQMAISAAVQGGTAEHAIYFRSAAGLEPVVVAGDPAPGFDDAVFRCAPSPDFPGCGAPTFGEISLDERSRIAFGASVMELDSGLYVSGIFLVDDGVVEPIAVRGDPAPGTGRPFSGFPLGRPAMSEAGGVAFVGVADTPGPGADVVWGLFVRDVAGTIEPRVLGGTPAPGTGGGLFSTFWDPVAMDATGRRLAALSDVGGFGLFRFTDNAPPLADAGPDQRLECSSPATSVLLDGSRSTDPDADELAFLWKGPFPDAAGRSVEVELPPGRAEITLEVSDGFGGSSSDSVAIRVVDSTSPSVKASLWPVASPRLGQRRGPAFIARFGCSDACDGTPRVDARFDGRSVESGDVLRLDRGSRPLLEIECVDASGNATSISVGPGRRGPGRRIGAPSRWKRLRPLVPRRGHGRL